MVAPFSEEFTFRACMVPVLLGQSSESLCLCCSNDTSRLLLSVLGHHYQPSLLRSGSFPPHGGEDQERWSLLNYLLKSIFSILLFRPGYSHLLPGVDVPVRLHHHLRDVLRVPLHQNWTLRGSVCCSRLLQFHGISGLHGSDQLRAKEENAVGSSVRGGGCAFLLAIGASDQSTVVQQQSLPELAMKRSTILPM